MIKVSGDRKIVLCKESNFRPLTALICCISIDSSMPLLNYPAMNLPIPTNLGCSGNNQNTLLGSHPRCSCSGLRVHSPTEIPMQQQTRLAGQKLQLLHWQILPRFCNYFMPLKNFYLIGCFFLQCCLMNSRGCTKNTWTEECEVSGTLQGPASVQNQFPTPCTPEAQRNSGCCCRFIHCPMGWTETE